MKHFGGSHLKSNPKTKRPVATKRSMHLVMRSSLATGRWSLLKKREAIEKIIRKQAKRFGGKVYGLANAGNHLDMLVMPSSRKAFNAFLRAISGLIARIITGIERGSAKKKEIDQRSATRPSLLSQFKTS